ncbi:MAG: hypothetical protein JSW27_02340 [Phycisphaerales bacterium]|nr:MAG: hypothetical protein JSW27_02340 [Phycisphaerales bacterium]
MKSRQAIDVGGHSRYWAGQLVLLVPAFLYLWLGVDSRLLYRGFGTVLADVPVFSSGWLFLRQSLGMPGGLVVYLSGYLSQWYHHAWAGALIVTLAALLVAVLVERHFTYASLPRTPALVCLPAICVLLLVAQYRHPLGACLTVSLGLLFSLAFERLPWHRASLRLPLYCLLVVVGYALVGAGGVFVFAIMTAIYSLFVRRRWWPSVFVIVASVVLIRGLSEYVYLLPFRTALRVATPFSADLTAGMKMSSRMLLATLYAFVPVAVAVMLVGKMAWTRKETRRAGKTRDKKGEPRSRALVFGRRGVALLLPVLVLAVGLALAYDGPRKDAVQINACARQQQWSRLLELARDLPKGKANIACNHDINRALYHTGRLPYEMFSFPQNPHALLLTRERRPSSLTQLQLCELFTELGNLNTAEKMAGELLATDGNLALVLEKLAWIQIIKGQAETARVYLNVLLKDPIYGNTAREMLNGLDRGFAPQRAAWIERIRSCVPTDPYGVTYGGSVEQILTGLLEQNPRNRMAFEYLMASYLLTRQLDKVIANLDRLADFDYEGMPTYFEEALLIWRTMRHEPIDPAALGISLATYKRYQSFLQISRSLQSGNQQATLNRLVREFGSSYFFYYGFGRVGVAARGAAGPRPLARAE